MNKLQYFHRYDFATFIVSKGLGMMLIAILWNPGGRLNKKDGLTRYGDSHVKDKTS